MIHLRRPLPLALLAFLLGLLTALRLPLAVLPSAILFLVVLAVAWRTSGSSNRGTASHAQRTLVILAFVAAGVLVGAVQRRQIEIDCRGRFGDGETYALQGWLGAAHRTPHAGEAPALLPLLNPSIAANPDCHGPISVRLATDRAMLPAGTSVQGIGVWRAFSNPVVRSRWPRNPRFRGYFLVDSLAIAESDEAGAAPSLRMRAAVDRKLEQLFPERLEIMEALVLGRREYVDRATRDRFARAGLSHLLAISGMHVGLIAGMILLLANLLRVRRRYAVLLTIAFTWAYIATIGAGASAIRAATMISLAMAASLLQRPSAPAAIVATAAFVVLALDPGAVLDPGFQLSFAGVLGILLLRRPLLTAVPDQIDVGRVGRSLLDAFIVGAAAFAATAPIVAHHFGIVAPISLVAGVPAVPLLALALIGALGALLLSGLSLPLAQLLAAGSAVALELLNQLAAAAATVPFGHHAVAPPPWWSWGVAMLAGCLAWSFTRGRSRRLRVFTAAGPPLAVLLLWPLLARAAIGGAEVHFIDVGQGDAIAIRTPADRWVLIDAGPAGRDFDAGERRVLPFLRRHGARRLEAMVLTHPDLDHIGGAVAVLAGLPVHYVFEPGWTVGKNSYLQLLGAIEPTTTSWRAARAGRTMKLDGIRFEFLWPEAEIFDASEDANQISTVVRMVYGDFELLLTGDVGVDVERALVHRHGRTLRSDVLKLGHHGSATSTAEELLDVVDPQLAIVSAGRRNRYGHPAPAVLRRVERREIPIARTDREGTVSLQIAAGGSEWWRVEW